ncbi:MAG: serine/threonine protein kinase [bacterium]|nr:serine/threonine protein kinase [bacterium]
MKGDPGAAENPDSGVDREDLERRLAEALEIADREGPEALARHLGPEADLPPELREALEGLRRADLLTQEVPQAAEAPSMLGEFRIKRQLGEGGMGVVYLAEQSSLGREVALKIVRPDLLVFDGARERFRREIDAVARLEHPAIVPILATGNADGVPYYAMPRLPGMSGHAVVEAMRDRRSADLSGSDLWQLLRRDGDDSTTNVDDTFAGSWWQAAVRLVRKAALGIEHAHMRGILHRDLKPSNLMLSADGRATVLDFGLAQGRGAGELTRTGTAAGSPAYMSPEQARGEPADERTDVYGLAATLSCLVGLRPPFAAAGPESLRQQILAGQRQELRRHADVPPELAIVIDSAMDVDRARRHESALAFANDLQAVLDGTAIGARRLPWAVRIRRVAQRHRAATTGVAVALLFLAILPVLLFWQQREQNSKLQEANAELAKVNSQVQTANAQLQAQIERSDNGMRVSIDAIESLLSRVAKDKLRNQPATQEIALGLTEDAVALFDRLEDESKYRRRVQWLRIKALSQMAQFQDTLGKIEGAKATGRRLIALTEEFEQEAPEPAAQFIRAQCHAALCNYAFEDGDVPEIDSRLELARAGLGSLLGSERFGDSVKKELGMLESMVSHVEQARGRRSEAEAASRRSVELMADVTDRPHLRILSQLVRINRAQFLRRYGQFDGCYEIATAVLGEVQDVAAPEVGWPVPRSIRARALEELFLARFYAKDYAAAIELAPPALAALDDVLGDYPSAAELRRRRGACAGNLGLCYSHVDDYESALLHVRDAVSHLERVLQRSPGDRRAHRFLVSQFKTLTWLLRKRGDWVELEQAARAFAAIPLSAKDRQRAARELLYCAPHAEAERRKAVLDEAMAQLLRAREAGGVVAPDDGAYAALRDHPDWDKLVND